MIALRTWRTKPALAAISLMLLVLIFLSTREQRYEAAARRELARLGAKIQLSRFDPFRLRPVMGDWPLSFFDQIWMLQARSLSEAEMDTLMDVIVRLKKLRHIDLNSCSVTDGSLEKMRADFLAMDSVRYLDIGNTDITDESTTCISEMPRLVWLNLHSASIGDEGASRLRSLTELECLIMSRTKISDIACDDICRIPKLVELNISETSISDKGILRISTATRVANLSLRGTRISNSAMLHIRALTNLQYLNIESTAINDAAIEDLSECSKLKRLDLSGTQISSPGIDELRRRLPNCNITYQLRP